MTARPAWLRMPWRFGSGQATAALYGTLLAAISLGAWISLGVQVRRLVGAHGLLPVVDFMDAVRDAGAASWSRLPTIFLWTQSDDALVAGVFVGAALSLLALAGIRRRTCFALSTLLYLSYVTVGRTFFSFQWDNLLLECGLLAACLPGTRPSPIAHFVFRALLFKLYFESGLAKWQSPLHDWQDGSAMTYYYETAPLPTALAWFAHNLPAWWHHLESRATLVLELVVPFAIFGPRRARLFAAASLTIFQLINFATANYGFFCTLAVALHVFLLDEADVERLPAWLRRPHAPRPLPPSSAPASDPLASDVRFFSRAAAWLGAAVWLGLSLLQAAFHFGGDEPGLLLTALASSAERAETYRVINTYHLFASITRERVEPEFQTLEGDAASTDESAWTPHDLRHKPGALARRPDFVAPHQPRLDFQLWFYGLGYQRGQPAYVRVLVERMCEDAAAVQDFFAAPLPAHPRAVRIVYWQYHFTTPAERRATGAWWRRERVGVSSTVTCP
ncbi:MAG TPA: lipase maturation factor family protein [Polyangia bacterium]|nr:lipase maturation factor family protein [Polyangia bacterium]